MLLANIFTLCREDYKIHFILLEDTYAFKINKYNADNKYDNNTENINIIVNNVITDLDFYKNIVFTGLQRQSNISTRNKNKIK